MLIGNDAVDENIDNSVVDESSNQDNSIEDSQDNEPKDNEQIEELEEIEFDFGGNKLKVPKNAVPEDIANKLNDFSKGIWSDYTKKSQAIAEVKKAFEAKLEAVNKLEKLTIDVQKVNYRASEIADRLEQLRSIDVSRLSQEDYSLLQNELNQLQIEGTKILSESESRERLLKLERDNFEQKAFLEGKEMVLKTIPDFKENEVIEYAVSLGIPKNQAEKWALSPRETIVFHKAMLFDKINSKKNQASNQQVKAATAITPVAAKGGKVAKDPDKMSPEEYRDWRNQQLKR